MAADTARAAALLPTEGWCLRHQVASNVPVGRVSARGRRRGMLVTLYRAAGDVWFVPVWALVLNPLPSQFLPKV